MQDVQILFELGQEIQFGSVHGLKIQEDPPPEIIYPVAHRVHNGVGPVQFKQFEIELLHSVQVFKEFT